jgi:hypothetical protein
MTSGYLPGIAGLDPRLLVGADGSAQAGEDIVRA